MTDREIEDLMLDCGLTPIEKHEWLNDHYVNSDSFIEGDYVALMQFARELIKIERQDCIEICEALGDPMDIASAIRARI